MDAKPATETPFREPYDFSLVLGGPLFQLYRRAHLSGAALELLCRRTVVICLFVWLPLLALSALEGHAWDGTIRVPFLWDVHAQVRFLVALPLFIGAEVVVHWQMLVVVRQFILRGLVPERARPRFDAAVTSALRLRNSVLAELLLLTFAYLVGVLIFWPAQGALHVTTWYALPAGRAARPTLAGWWLLVVSLPLFQFFLLRWYFRLFIWARFLWQVSRIDLRLVPTHPDQAAGLGFLSTGVMAFTPLLLGQGAILAGWIANRILFTGARLSQFKIELFDTVAVLLLSVLGPMLVFAPRLGRLRRAGLREYGTLAQRYVRDFDQKWLRGGADPSEPLVGSPDLQSLADLGNSFQLVRAMRPVPFDSNTLLQLLLMILLPLLPLVFTIVSLDELVSRLVKVLF